VSRSRQRWDPVLLTVSLRIKIADLIARSSRWNQGRRPTYTAWMTEFNVVLSPAEDKIKGGRMFGTLTCVMGRRLFAKCNEAQWDKTGEYFHGGIDGSLWASLYLERSTRGEARAEASPRPGQARAEPRPCFTARRYAHLDINTAHEYLNFHASGLISRRST